MAPRDTRPQVGAIDQKYPFLVVSLARMIFCSVGMVLIIQPVWRSSPATFINTYSKVAKPTDVAVIGRELRPD